MSARGTVARDPADRSTGAAERLFPILYALAREVTPHLPADLRVTADTSLEHDLGIDSLARVELGLRIERAFAVRLPEDAIMKVETAGELLAAIVAAEPSRIPGPPLVHRANLEAVAAAPDEAHTLIDVIDFHLDTHGERIHVRMPGDDRSEVTMTYRQLWRGAQAVAAGLRELTVAPGQAVAIMLPTGSDFLWSFLGIVLAGGIPVPIYPPVRRSQIEEHLRRQGSILRSAEAVALVTTPEAKLFGRLIRSQVACMRAVTTAGDLRAAAGPECRPVIAADSTALLQYTSGSTGDPKGVILSHGNLLANIRAMGRAFDVTSTDVVVSWLPLYHDMGLIGAWLGSLYYACPLVLMSPLSFLARPARWLWAIDRYRGTLSAAPNFAYEMCRTKISDEDIAELDLASWRMAGNGAEPVSAVTLEGFAARFAPHGFRRGAMTPMYGLAENAVALASSPVGRGPRIDRVAREPLARRGEAVPAAASDAAAMAFVSCGIPVPGHQVRVVDRADREVGERREGLIQFHGPSATAGYLRNPEKTAGLFDGVWLNTGDLGYIADGELYVTGRVKDVIVRAGRNLYPEEIEAAVGDIPGVRKGRVAVFGSTDPATATEKLVVVAETRHVDPERRRGLADRVRRVVTGLAELPPEDVVIARPGAVLKTANGKLRRAACRALYEAGRSDRPPPALWRQIAGLAQASVAPQLQRFRQAAADLAFAAWFWIVYRLIAPPFWLGVVLLPGLGRRRRLFRLGARLMLRLLGITPAVRGLTHIPQQGPHILVANHASYLDGLVLAAALPAAYAFVAKRELAGETIAGPFFRALGTAFVERFDPAGGIRDARSLIGTLEAGTPLIVFPEGTFDRRPGLRTFEMGAFVAATEAVVAIVPLAIRGTRSILRADSSFPRYGSISVTVEPAIAPEGKDWQAAIALRDRARAAVLRHCGEPDLAHEPKPI